MLGEALCSIGKVLGKDGKEREAQKRENKKAREQMNREGEVIISNIEKSEVRRGGISDI